ncbi:hypothetical protein BDV96DRAFT_595111 [Lophiotrema nucula]|uniref:Prokaryotic phospholipase A2-domain-containing protein n=1 Tax=Lophiotrema nucula TaxID=690887 RepID=A0A6A5ZQX9_9PLEO|nr:hypothetical protein BDV96DRAFT_595111 [Lophiotrema nucula]
MFVSILLLLLSSIFSASLGSALVALPTNDTALDDSGNTSARKCGFVTKGYYDSQCEPANIEVFEGYVCSFFNKDSGCDHRDWLATVRGKWQGYYGDKHAQAFKCSDNW